MAVVDVAEEVILRTEEINQARLARPKPTGPT